MIEPGNDPAAQALIEFNAEIAALNLRLAGRNIRGYSE
jgi:hypothetical protein